MASADGLREIIRSRAELAHGVAVETVILTLSDAAPVDTGRLATGVAVTSSDYSGDRFVSTVESTARSDEGFDYGEVQDRGTGPIEGNPVLRFEVGGVVVFARRTSGVPRTGWWTDTLSESLWVEALAGALSWA